MEYFFVYVIGAALYCRIEILFRGWTHWSMFFVSGGCFLMMYLLSQTAMPLWAKWLSSAGLISLIEVLAGIILNLVLKLGVWDYSSELLNILGQVCPLYSFFWLLLSIAGISLCAFIRPHLRRLLQA